MKMNQLERLARNPHYKMNQKELEELAAHRINEHNRQERRKKNAKHNSKTPVKHKTGFKKHNPALPEED